MENKLEFKHIAPYLAHGLKVIMEGKKTNVAWISTKNIAVIRPGSIGEIKKIKWEYAGINIKPILRPLSDLTKEIKHNGEKFVPIEYNAFRYDKEIIIDFQNKYIYYEALKYGVLQKLIQWHFDVFGLIDKGLAVPLT